MSMDLGVKSFGTAPEYFVAGMHPIAKSIKTAASDLAAHAPVALDGDGKIIAVAAGSESTVYGIVPESCAAEEDAVVYLTGEFFADSLAYEDGVTAASIETALRNMGIFLK